MSEDTVIRTHAFKSGPVYIAWREARVAEAIAFAGGSIQKQRKHLISVLPNEKEAFFLKPGKETLRNKPNIHDMFPCIGRGNDRETDDYTFEIIWEYLIKISIINELTFKKVLILLYRLCYFLDHVKDKDGNIRYAPSAELSDYIGKVGFALNEGFQDKFEKEAMGLWEFLYFIDLLGWNEDVKYHAGVTGPDFSGNRRTGRPNTIISVISVPLMINEFLANIMKNVKHIAKIDVRLILSVMQKLTQSRGICVLSNVKLQAYLSPYLMDGVRR